MAQKINTNDSIVINYSGTDYGKDIVIMKDGHAIALISFDGENVWEGQIATNFVGRGVKKEQYALSGGFASSLAITEATLLEALSN